MNLRGVLAAILVLAPSSAAAERATSPGDATVFVRLVGSLHAEVEEAGVKQAADLDRVEIGTGSGFVVSPHGYVLTNEHVISNGEQDVVTSSGRHVKITVKVSRIQVCFQQTTMTTYGLSSQCLDAAVAAVDAALDLALLFINGTDLPYVALGDSDALVAGVPAEAFGYPFGRELEVGRLASAPDLVPQVTATSGTISAVRAGDAGERRYLQISNSVNPGNSGGPLVDREGFAIGVIRMRLARATGIAFAIPVNAVKDFLESRGLDTALPARRLRLGAFQSIEHKRIGLRAAEGATDMSAFRTHVETDPGLAEIPLRIDRVFTPWNAKQLEQALIGTQAFERIPLAGQDSQSLVRAGEAPTLLGHAAGTAADGKQAISMEYAIVDLGAEKLVARYVGSSEQIAFNRRAVRESLASLQGQRFLDGSGASAETIAWSSPSATNGQRVLPMPAGWIIEPGTPSSCSGLPPASAATTASAPEDFSVALRAAAWSTTDLEPDAAASACSSGRGSLGRASYASRGEWLGVSYVVEGAFVRVGPRQIMQLEVVSPDQKSGFGRALLAAWVKKTAE